MEIALVSSILILALLFLFTEKMTVDMVGIGIIVALMLTRILTPIEAVRGFANPAVITVGAGGRYWRLSHAHQSEGAGSWGWELGSGHGRYWVLEEIVLK